MKTKMLITIGLGLLFLNGNSQYTQNYFHFDGLNLNDHGYANEIIDQKAFNASSVGGMVVAGAAFTTNNRPSAFIAKYDYSGNSIFHRFFRLNGGLGTVCEAAGVVEATNATVKGFGLLCYTNAAPAQTVLIKTDLNGNFLWKREIGSLPGTSVAYDATLNRFLCLTNIISTQTNNPDLYLVVVDANTGAVVFTRFFDSCGGEEVPATVIHDVLSNQYVCLATARLFIGNTQVMVASVSPTNTLPQIFLFGDPTKNEFAVDFFRDPSNPRYIIGGYLLGAPNTPFFADLNLTGTVANITQCTSLIGNNTPRRIALINGRYLMVGRQDDPGNVNGFLVTMNPSGGGLNYLRYGQPPIAGNEELRDITPSTSQIPTLMCGTHQRTVAWLGSAANTSYNWVLTADVAGAGTCPQISPYTSVSYAPPINTCTVTAALLLVSTTIPQANFAQQVTRMDECANPNRMANSNVIDNTFVQAYPNPASSELTISLQLEQGENVVMELFDMAGRLARTEQLGGQSALTTISVAELAEGVYFLRVRRADEILSEQKIVIMR
jgi:Secretion system C-terminal sorting domain